MPAVSRNMAGSAIKQVYRLGDGRAGDAVAFLHATVLVLMADVRAIVGRPTAEQIQVAVDAQAAGDVDL